MAFVINNPLSPNGQQTQVPGANPLAIQAPVATTGAPGAGPGGGKSTSTAPTSPNQIVNLQDYLTANAPQIGQQANLVSGQLTNQYGQAVSDINSGVNQYTGQVNAGYTPANPTLVSQAASNPAEFVLTPGNTPAFQAQLNDQYTGPTAGFETTAPYQSLNAEVNNAANTAQGIGNPAGNFAGVQNFLKTNVETNPTQGENVLDAALLQQSPAAIGQIQGAAQPLNTLPTTLANNVTSLDQLMSQAPSQAQAAQNAALQALATGQSNEATNLTNEQNTIQGIVNQYNQSVNTINPTVQSILSAINNYIAANPQATIDTSNNPLAPISNLQPINMPSESTYASPLDYATIAALQQLGGNVSNLPITSATANEAQTFQIPTALQNAVGQFPTVESSLQNEVNSIGNALNTYGGTNSVQAYQAQQNLINQQQPIVDSLQPQVQAAFAQLQQAGLLHGSIPQNPYSQTDPKYQQAQTQIDNYNSLNSQLQNAQNTISGAQGTINSIAQNLGWFNNADTGYQSLVNQINQYLGQLGNVGVPSLTYTPQYLTNPVTGALVSPTTAKNIGESVGIPAGVATAAPAAFDASLASAMGESGLEGTTAGANVVPPVAVAVAATDVIRNALSGNTPNFGTLPTPITSNPITSAFNAGLDITGAPLDLTTMVLPPEISQSIEGSINNVMNDIGSFFGGMF